MSLLHKAQAHRHAGQMVAHMFVTRFSVLKRAEHAGSGIFQLPHNQLGSSTCTCRARALTAHLFSNKRGALKCSMMSLRLDSWSLNMA